MHREYILNVIRNSCEHPTANEIFSIVKEKLHNISLGTVYRNLSILEKKGYIKKLDFGYSKRRYDGNMTKHYHIRCIKCNKLKDIPDRLIKHSLEDIEKAMEYNVTDFKIEFCGICNDCEKT